MLKTVEVGVEPVPTGPLASNNPKRARMETPTRWATMAGMLPALSIVHHVLNESRPSSGTVSRSSSVKTLRCLGGKQALLVSILITCIVPVASVTCTTCMDTIPGCRGGTDCPLIANVVENVMVFETGRLGTCPTTAHVLPSDLRAVFPRHVAEALVGIATAPPEGQMVDLTTEAYDTVQSVVQAAISGHCTMDTALSELASRAAAADPADFPRIKLGIDMLKSKADSVLAGTRGVLTYIWARVGAFVETKAGKSGAGAVQIQMASASKTPAADLTATVRRAKTEPELYNHIHYFIWVVTAIGLCNPLVLFQFFKDTVFDGIQVLKLPWTVCQELVLVCFKDIESDTTRELSLANIFSRGKMDTLIMHAKTNEAVFFRARGGEPRAGRPSRERFSKEESGSDNVTWNGKSTATCERCCAAFNSLERGDHTRSMLLDDGTCKFAHLCNQWVSGKGPRGQCKGKHPRSQCTNPNKVDTPATE